MKTNSRHLPVSVCLESECSSQYLHPKYVGIHPPFLFQWQGPQIARDTTPWPINVPNNNTGRWALGKASWRKMCAGSWSLEVCSCSTLPGEGQCSLQKVFPRDEKPLLKGEMPNRIFPYIMLTIVSTFSIGKKTYKTAQLKACKLHTQQNTGQDKLWALLKSSLKCSLCFIH